MDNDGETRYYVDGAATYAGLVYVDGYFYYINSGLKAVKDCDYWVTKNNGVMPSATYTFDTEGRMVDPPAVENVTESETASGGERELASTVVTAYSYVYNGSSLSQMTVTTTVDNGTPTTKTLNFAYDASGTPATVSYDGATYYYITNLQGDVMAILDSSGTAVVQYTYDAWGKILTTTGSMASTLGAHNPLRYRGYVYDTESSLYYLQSRYYDPELGRFINADAYASTGQGILGNNMFTYCLNNPTTGSDPCGTCRHRIDFWNDCDECGGKTLGDKLVDFATVVADYQAMVREDQRKQTELQLQLVNSMIQAQVRAEQEMAEQQRMQDALVGKFVASRFSTLQKAGNTMVFLGSSVQFGLSIQQAKAAAAAGTAIGGPVAGAIGAGLVLIGSFFVILAESE